MNRARQCKHAIVVCMLRLGRWRRYQDESAGCRHSRAKAPARQYGGDWITQALRLMAMESATMRAN
eukprot:10541809-Prorocentrum_lima.AAC.1